jgi:hypothetical protein
VVECDAPAEDDRHCRAVVESGGYTVLPEALGIDPAEPRRKCFIRPIVSASDG